MWRSSVRVVIGGGLLGLEAANGLLKRGMSVAVVHLMDTLMERQLDPVAGGLLLAELDGRGLNFFMNGQTEEILGETRVEGVRLADGREVPGDLVVMAIGIRPNIDLAKRCDLEINRGIVVDDTMRTSDPDIFAVGECAEHRGKTYGLVAPLYEMAKICADHLAYDEVAVEGYRGSFLSTKLKVTGIDLFSAGNFSGGEDCSELTFHDSARRIYKKLVLRDGRLEGVVLYGDVADSGWYFELLRKCEDVTAYRDGLLFGQNIVAAMGNAPKTSTADLPGDYQICGCNGVCKSAITDAIAAKGLTTLDAVRAHTKASASCGSCTPMVESLLKASLGDAFQVWARNGAASVSRNSTAMGIALEKMTWGSWHPHKVKLAVSGCPRNCAEATIKDFGVIAVESGWELHVGGNGGIKLRGTDLLCKVSTADEVLEYCGAFLQLYREEARYLDRTAPWIERVGLDCVKARIVEDDAGRKELYERFLYAQQFFQTDPWEENARKDKPSSEYRLLAKVD